MTENVSIRFAAPHDLDFVWSDRHIPAETMQHKIERQEIIVAEWNGDVVGCLQLEYLWSLVPYIALIWVEPEYRRQGMGKALLRYAEAFLQHKGHKVLYSSSEAAEPEPQAWHRHMGFQECGIIAGMNEGGIGEVFFRKQLEKERDL